jgi:hypothetical protein
MHGPAVRELVSAARNDTTFHGLATLYDSDYVITLTWWSYLLTQMLGFFAKFL